MIGIVRKLIVGLIALFVLAAVSAIVAVFVLLGTESGGRWLVGQAAGFMPGELDVEDQRGDVLSGITAGRIIYRYGTFTVELEDVRIDTRLGDLLRAQLDSGFLLPAPAVPGELGAVLSGLSAGRVVFRNPSFAADATDVRADIRPAELLQKRIVVESASASGAAFGETRLADIGLAGYIGLHDEFPLAGRLSWTERDGRAAGSGRFSGDLGRLEFDHRVSVPAGIDVTGVINDVLTQPSLDAQAYFTEWPVTVAQQQVSLRDGRLALAGTAGSLQISASADIPASVIGPVRVGIDASGNMDQLTIESARAEALGGQIAATGTVAPGNRTARLYLTGAQLDPATVRAGLDGRLDFSAIVDAGSGGVVDIRLERLSGKLLDRPVAGAGTLTLREGLVERLELSAGSGPNRFEFSGGMVPVMTGRLRLSAPDLAALWPGLDGALEGRAQFGGTLDAPTANVSFRGARLRFATYGIEHAFVDGQIGADGSLDWSVEIEDVSSGVTPIGNLRLHVRGSLNAHELDLRLSDGIVDARLMGRGAWRDARWETVVESANIDGGAAGTWKLREALPIVFGAGDWTAGAHCWTDEPAEVCTDGISMRDGRWVAAAALRHFPLATLDPWLGSQVRIRGEADADLSLDWRDGSLLGAGVAWRQGPTRLSYSGDPAEDPLKGISTTLNSFSFTLAADATGASARAQAAGKFGLVVTASAALDGPPGRDARLTGRIDARVPDISELQLFVNRFVLTSSLGGEFVAGADISGTLRNPVFTGRADLRDGAAGIELNGIELSEINLSLTSRELGLATGFDTALAVEGSARSGDGFVRVSGLVDWTDERGIFSNLHITGEKFEILRLPDQRAVVAPDLDLVLDEKKISVAGRLRMPEARFVVKKLGSAAVSVSGDVVVHDAQEAVRPRAIGPQLVGAFDLELGDDVSFAGFGIETRLVGGLKFVAEADMPLNAEGSLQLADGRYEMFGKVLSIEQGSLNFYGPLDDPVLDVRAARRVNYEGRNIRVGVIVAGRISRQLEFQLFSDPVFDDKDILSYMLSDRPASTTDVSGDTISGAAISLGLSQLSVMQQVSSGLKLDEVGLTDAGNEDAAVVAGKRINEDIYVRYTYGLFNRIGTLLIRYDIGRGFSIEAGSGEQQTLDLLYWIDR